MSVNKKVTVPVGMPAMVVLLSVDENCLYDYRAITLICMPPICNNVIPPAILLYTNTFCILAYFSRHRGNKFKETLMCGLKRSPFQQTKTNLFGTIDHSFVLYLPLISGKVVRNRSTKEHKFPGNRQHMLLSSFCLC